VDGSPGDGLSLWRDATVILVVSAIIVWIVIDDLQSAIARLQVQISKFNQSQAHVAHLARHDALTGLPNRSLGHDRIGQAIEQAGRHRSRLAMLFVDVDHLKAINDGLGHGAGDELLREIAGRLEGSVRKSDIVSRHGGDEFLIGLTDIVDLQDASTVATTILANLTQPFVIGATEVACNCSIGVAVYPDDAAEFQTLLRRADLAMGQAKESGRNAVRFFDQAMQTDLHNSLLLLSDLRQALARREFELHYQPVIALDSGRVLGAEALIRWRRPDGRLFLPGQFIEAAERSGLIVDIGAWVLEEACRQLVEWQAAGCGDFTMAVNLSVVQFRRGNIDEVVRQALERTGLRPECLEVEITESTLVQDAESFILSLQRIKALGVKISIDDFGTGYSNLSYLQRFAVDKLKIDQSFTLQLLRTVQDRAIVNAIVQIARSLELVVTAEGIEDDSVLRTLVDMGCTQGQGYFFGRPQSVADFAARHLGLAAASHGEEEDPALCAGAPPLAEPGLQGG
jgi:diguanylate cyclase (GGDEF)-like protein